MTKPTLPIRRCKGFTLIELLIVMTIIAVLALVIFGGSQQVTLRARKVVCRGIMKTAVDGVTGYMADHGGKPPAPASNQSKDTIYGDPGGVNTTEWLMAALTGRKDGGTGLLVIEAGTSYADFEIKGEPRAGLYVPGPDKEMDPGRLYDPWGRELMFVVNSPIQSQYSNNGEEDEILYSGGLCVYLDTKGEDPRPCASISLGADSKKGKGLGEPTDGGQYFNGSDDVISW